MSVEFTQYLRPNGRQRTVYIELAPDAEAKAGALAIAGYRLECEELMTGEVSLTIFDTVEEEDVACEICKNGPDVPPAVTSLINSFEMPTYRLAGAEP